MEPVCPGRGRGASVVQGVAVCVDSPGSSVGLPTPSEPAHAGLPTPFQGEASSRRKGGAEIVGSNLYLHFARAVLRRPRLLGPMLGAAWAFRRLDWFRRLPFLPLPSARYMRWRMETAYGDPDLLPPLRDLERFLVWGSRMRRRVREDSRG
jgi:hypothetical protein